MYVVKVKRYTPNWDVNDPDTDFGDTKLVSESVIYMSEDRIKCIGLLEACADAIGETVEYGAKTARFVACPFGDADYHDSFEYEVEEVPE